MPKLKNINAFTPRGPQLLLPEIGMQRPLVGSIHELRGEFDKIVRRNPSIAQKHNWPTDPKEQMDFVEQREVKRLLAQGWVEFLDFGGAGEIAVNPSTVKKNWKGAVAVAVNTGKAAVAAYRDLFGPGGPVDRKLAEARASVCVQCPQNDSLGAIGHYFVAPSASGLMGLLGALKDTKIVTSHDEKLGVCKACMCPMRVKVNVRLPVIQQGMMAETWSKLDKRCWILGESGRA